MAVKPEADPITFRQNRLKGDSWAIVSAVTTGAGLTAAKSALAVMPALSFNAYLFFFGAIITAADVAISGKLRETVTINRRQLLFLLGLSALFAISVYCLFYALSLSQPATVSFLSRLEMAVTIILASLFLKERMNRAELIGLVVVAVGIVVMRYGASVELSRAIALVMANVLLTGTGEVLIKWKINLMSHRTLILYRNTFMAIIFAVAGLIRGDLIMVTDFKLLAILGIAGFLLPYLGRLGFIKAMYHIKVSRASIITQSQPFFAGIVALLVLGIFPPAKEILGGLLIVGGVVLIRLIEMRFSSQPVR